MTSDQIYRKYNIPPNLQLHMYRVTAVGARIADHWTGPPLNHEGITSALLLHDIGNIAKFDLTNHPQLLGKEAKRVNYWRKTQKKFVGKYGLDEHEATIKIAKELGLAKDILFLLEKFRFSNLPQIVTGNNWNLKVCAYADARVSPHAVTTLSQRLQELFSRYKKRFRELRNAQKTRAIKQNYLKLESQIQENVNQSLPKISDESIKPYLENLPKYQIGKTVANFI